MVQTLIFLPILAAVFLAITSHVRIIYLLCVLILGVGSLVSISLFVSPENIPFYFSDTLKLAVGVADVVLLFYFLYQGITYKNRLIMFLSLLQLVLYGWAESIAPSAGTAEMIVDDLSKTMFLIINIVGGIIVLYSVRYMEEESASPFKKRLLPIGLLLFLSVMNAIVCANSLLLFFFLFEMTTLASYLLIAFRDDAISRTNAMRALWMNQIGGVVILLGTLVAIYQFDTVMLDALIQNSGGMLLLSVALLSMAALVKGAAIPFDGWLLGAMVAPTPVSAMLHSATMVKIAPFLILKLAPAWSETTLGDTFSAIGALVFVAASYLALSRSVFKEILGYSTVALLGLMMALAAIGTKESMALAMVLMVFHALSKALLFLAAGVLEKRYHLKNVEDMAGIAHRAPETIGYVMFGFISLTLPPFGLFMGKMFAIESVSSLLRERPILLIVLLGIIVGSALLVLLYFKVSSALISNSSDVEEREIEILPLGFRFPMMALSILAVLTAAWFMLIQDDSALMLFLLPLIVILLLPRFIRKMDRYDRTQPYHCGEKEPFDAALVYYEPSARIKQLIYWSFGLLFVGVAFVGAFS